MVGCSAEGRGLVESADCIADSFRARWLSVSVGVRATWETEEDWRDSRMLAGGIARVWVDRPVRLD